jgi:PadR family transcriptional regulator PadR
LQIHNILMYICPMYSSELIKGTLKTIVLKLLSETKEMYGYEITQKVKELTGNKIQITEGALYPTLHALEDDGIVTTEVVNIGKRVRKYYKLTPKGKNSAKEKVNEFADFIHTMKFLLDIKPQLG